MNDDTPRTIAQLGDAILRRNADAVNDLHCIETRQIIDAMRTTLASTQGVGLAAPQIGISKRIIIVASRPTPRYPNSPRMEPVVMINPIYQVLSDTTEKDWEGCLSIP
ncbi:MAG: peptide deformylase, partial [Gammaproteobacteria bacterium]